MCISEYILTCNILFTLAFTLPFPPNYIFHKSTNKFLKEIASLFNTYICHFPVSYKDILPVMSQSMVSALLIGISSTLSPRFNITISNSEMLNTKGRHLLGIQCN